MRCEVLTILICFDTVEEPFVICSDFRNYSIDIGHQAVVLS
jgi:hypothetical protein